MRAFYTGVAVTVGVGAILAVATSNVPLGAGLGVALGVAVFMLLNLAAKKKRAN